MWPCTYLIHSNIIYLQLITFTERRKRLRWDFCLYGVWWWFAVVLFVGGDLWKRNTRMGCNNGVSTDSSACTCICIPPITSWLLQPGIWRAGQTESKTNRSVESRRYQRDQGIQQAVAKRKEDPTWHRVGAQEIRLRHTRRRAVFFDVYAIVAP